MVRLFIGGLPVNVSDSDLRARFSPFGKVVSVDIVGEKANTLESPTGAPSSSCRGFAYIDVEFKDPGSTAKCIATYNGCKWRGHVLRVERAKDHYMLKLQREWDQSMAEQAGASNETAVPSVLKADELNTQLGQLRLVHSRHKSKIVQIDLADRSKVRTFFPPPKPLPLATLSWEPISNQSSFLYRQRTADEAAERLAARRRRAAQAAAAAAAAAAAENPDVPEDAPPATDAAMSAPTSQPAAAVAPPAPRAVRVVCFDSDQEAGPVAGAATAAMDLDRFGSGSEDEGPPGPQAGEAGPGERAKEMVLVPVMLPVVPPVLPLAGPKKKKSGRKRASSEHDLILQRQAMKALKRLGRLGKDMDMDEGAATGGERVLSMAVSQSSSSSSDKGGNSSSGNLPDDDSSDEDQDEEQEPEDDRRMRSLSGQHASTSAHYAPHPAPRPIVQLISQPASLTHQSSPDAPTTRVPPPSHAQKTVMMMAAAGGPLPDPEPGARQSSIVERRAAKAAQLSRGGPKLKGKQKGRGQDVEGYDSRPYDADSSGEEKAAPGHPIGAGAQAVMAQRVADIGGVEAGTSSIPPHHPLNASLDLPLPLPSAAFPHQDTPMTPQEEEIAPAVPADSPAGLGWELPDPHTLAALDLASLFGDAPGDGTMLPGVVPAWLSGGTLASPPSAARRMSRSRSGGSAGRESRESILPVTQLGQQFMRSGSEEELRSSWQAQREGLAADYKRKRRAAVKASMNSSHKTQRRK